MTVQRGRAGAYVEVYGRIIETDRRGNPQWVISPSPVWKGRVWMSPDRSQRAEVMGQQEIIVFNMGIEDMPALTYEFTGLWTHLKWNGITWDIVAPPLFHRGVGRHTRHWTVSIRKHPGQSEVPHDG